MTTSPAMLPKKDALFKPRMTMREKTKTGTITFMAFLCWSCTNALYYSVMEKINFTDAWTVQQGEGQMAEVTRLEAFSPDTSRVIIKDKEINIRNWRKTTFTILYNESRGATPVGNMLVLKRGNKRYMPLGKGDMVDMAAILQM